MLVLAGTALVSAQDHATDLVDGHAPTAPPPVTIAATQPAISTSLPTGANVALIRMEGLIYDFQLESLQRRADAAVAQGASLVVIEIDTPGGVAASALKISKHIKSMPVPAVAWINPEAYSAGIMIAAACDQIVMAPASATGDCAPIVPGMNLSPQNALRPCHRS